MKKHALLGAVLASLVSSQALGQFVTIASESFEYNAGDALGQIPGGGAGWFNDWWAGTNGDDLVATSPSIDALGQKATVMVNDGKAYRRLTDIGNANIIMPAPHDPNDFVFGVDDTSMYIRFRMERIGDDLWGGFALNTQFVGEHLFIGSPWQTQEIGIQDYTTTGNPVTVIPGTSPDPVQQIVARIDFVAGNDTLRLWIDPASQYPTTNEDLNYTLGDLTFNEIFFGSGGGAVLGYNFDDLQIESTGLSSTIGTNYCVSTVNSTGSAALIAASGSLSVMDQSLTLTAAPVPDQPGIFFFGPNQVQLAFGNGFRCVGGTLVRLPVAIGANNELIHDVDFGSPVVAPNLVGNTTWNFQGWYRDPAAGGAAFNLTDGTELMLIP